MAFLFTPVLSFAAQLLLLKTIWLENNNDTLVWHGLESKLSWYVQAFLGREVWFRFQCKSRPTSHEPRGPQTGKINSESLVNSAHLHLRCAKTWLPVHLTQLKEHKRISMLQGCSLCPCKTYMHTSDANNLPAMQFWTENLKTVSAIKVFWSVDCQTKGTYGEDFVANSHQLQKCGLNKLWSSGFEQG